MRNTGVRQILSSGFDVLNLRCILYAQEEVVNRLLDIQVWSPGERSRLEREIKCHHCGESI